MAAEKKAEGVFIKRKRLAGDSRSDDEILADRENLERRADAYWREKRKEDPTLDLWHTHAEFMLKEDPSFAMYYEKVKE